MTDFVDRNVKRVNIEKMFCPVGFFEEFITVFYVTMSQIETENNEKPKIFQFSKFSCILRHILDRLRGLECPKGSTLKEMVRPIVFNEEVIAML